MPITKEPSIGLKLASLLTGGAAGAVAGIPKYRQQQDLQMQAAIEQQKRDADADREYANQAEALGVSPVRDANGRVNRIATAAAIQRVQGALDGAKIDRDAKARAKAALDERAAAVGVDPSNAGAMPSLPQGFQFGQSQLPAQPAAKPLQQQVAEAEAAQKAKDTATEAEARAKATAPYENSFTQGDNYAVNGQSVGRAVRNLRTGQSGIMQPDGTLKPLPDGAVPITPTAINKNIVGATDFKKYKTDLTDSERSLRQFERYATSVGGMNEGVSTLADKFTAGVKTLLGNGQLDPAELARKAAQGQLQGLLGGNRVSVVGGGVLTEQDAERIIQRLGGDVGAMQNREVVMKALGELYQDRYAQYQDDFNFYNEAVDSYWGNHGFKKAPETDFNKLFGQPATNGSVPSGPVKIMSIKQVSP